MKKNIKVLTLTVCLILLVTALSGCSKQDPNAPSGYKTASNETVDYYLYVPQDWVVDTVDGSQLTAARVSEYDQSNISMMAYVDDGGEFSSVDEYFESYKSTLSSVFDKTAGENGGEKSSFELVSDESCLMGGAAANKYVYTATLGGVELKYMQVIALRGHTFYIFTYTAYAGSYDEDPVNGIIDNIVFK